MGRTYYLEVCTTPGMQILHKTQCLYVCMSVRMYVCTYVCMYVCITPRRIHTFPFLLTMPVSVWTLQSGVSHSGILSGSEVISGLGDWGTPTRAAIVIPATNQI